MSSLVPGRSQAQPPPPQKSHLKLSPLEVRSVARKTASEAIKEQREQFRQLGIMADWDSETETYRTMGELGCLGFGDGLIILRRPGV